MNLIPIWQYFPWQNTPNSSKLKPFPKELFSKQTWNSRRIYSKTNPFETNIWQLEVYYCQLKSIPLELQLNQYNLYIEPANITGTRLISLEKSTKKEEKNLDNYHNKVIISVNIKLKRSYTGQTIISQIKINHREIEQSKFPYYNVFVRLL